MCLPQPAPPPRTHQKRPYKIERLLLGRLVKALKTLRQRAKGKQADPDWSQYQEHLAQADDLLQKGEIAEAFRE